LTGFSNATGVMRESSHTFIAPLGLLRQVAASKRTWLQVETSSGIVESIVIDGPKDSKALYAIKRFLTEVDA
jgi:hypothetical protein